MQLSNSNYHLSARSQTTMMIPHPTRPTRNRYQRLLLGPNSLCHNLWVEHWSMVLLHQTNTIPVLHASAQSLVILCEAI